MPCEVLEGYEQDCNKDSLGGLSKMLVTNKSNIVSYTKVAGKITAFVLKTGKQFFNIQLVKSTSFYANTLTPNVQSGSFFYAQAATLVLNKIKATTSLFVETLAKASLVMIVEDKNGELVVLGLDNGLDLSGGTVGSGTGSADRNGYECQFSGEEVAMSHVDPTIIASLLLPAE